MRLRSLFWCQHSKKPVQGFEQGLNKDPPSHACLCHFQSAFCPTLPTPRMPGAFKWGQILFSKTLLLVLLQGMCARRESSPGHKHGRLACCRYTTGAVTQAKKQGSGCSRLPHCPFFFLSLKQHSVAAKQPTARGFEPLRAEPNGFLIHLLGHSGTLSDSAQGLHIPPRGRLSQHLRAHCQSGASKHICMTKCICISRESNPDHIDGNDVFCH